jgi:hypothetical protein
MGEKLPQANRPLGPGPAILGIVIGSAGMNAFAAHTTTAWTTSAAVTLGIAIPTLVYAPMRGGAALYIDRHAPYAGECHGSLGWD